MAVFDKDVFGSLPLCSNNKNKLGLSRAKLSTAGVEFCRVMLHQD